jgi:hypothetical protein
MATKKEIVGKDVTRFIAQAKKRIKEAYGNDINAFDIDRKEIYNYMDSGYENGGDWVDSMAAKYEIPRADEVTCPMAIAVLTIEVKKIKDKKHPAIHALAVLTELINQKYKN